MLETLTIMVAGAFLFAGGATWGAWITMRVKDNESPIPLAPVERGGVAYDEDEDETESEIGYPSL